MTAKKTAAKTVAKKAPAKKKPVATKFSFVGTVGRAHTGDTIQTYGTDFPLSGDPVAVPKDKIELFRRRTDFKEV